MNGVKRGIQFLSRMALTFLFVFVLLIFVVQKATVDGRSMETTFYDGDGVWVDKFSYRFTTPKRYDVIIFWHEADESYYIKRIIGLPGETVEIKDGIPYINDVALAENYGSGERQGNMDPVTLDAGTYFVMGDNRNNSLDSRSSMVGAVSRDTIIGRVVFP